MKIYKTIAVLFLFAFAVSIIGCGGDSDKAKVIKVYKATIEFYKSDDFKTNFSDEGYMEKKMNDILTEAGFENEKEFEATAKQFENDEDIRKLAVEMETVAEGIMNEVMEEMQKELDKTTEELEKTDEELEKTDEEVEKEDKKVEGDEKKVEEETDETGELKDDK